MKYPANRSVILALVLLVRLAATQSYADEQFYTSILSKEALKCVVSIEQMTSLTNGVSVGTGFLITTTNSHLVLVTAKHVILGDDGKVRQDLAYRINLTNGQSIFTPDFVVSALGFPGWIVSSNADVAVRMMLWGKGSDVFAYPADHLLPTKFIQPGAPVAVLGFPMGLRSETYTKAIVRQGIVAGVDDEIMLDAFVFPGNSGGPVLYLPTLVSDTNLGKSLINTEEIIGVVVNYIPYDDIAVSPQTKRPRIIFEENSGLCHVVPTEKIFEIMNYPQFREADKPK